MNSSLRVSLSPPATLRAAMRAGPRLVVFRLVALLFVILHSSFVIAEVPQLINYQGRVAVGTVNFEGSGQFKFALVDAAGTTTFWSNDGTSVAGSAPAAAVSLTVTKGLYSVLLGDATLPNMTIVPATVFTNADVRLRVWFNDGANGSQQLTPDQRIAAVGYAMMAGTVPDGSITSAKIGTGAVTNTQLAANAVQTANITAGSVGNAQLANASLTVTAGGGLGGGGAVSLGGAVTLTNAGVLSLTGGGGISVNSGTGAITLGSNATSANTASTIVLRDASGNFTAGTITGNLAGNASSATSATTATTAGSATSFTGTLTGDVTGTQGATTIPAATVTGKAITGFASGAGTVTASDSILTAINKLNGNTALKAAAGANSDITSLTGLATPLSISQGGTGSTTQNFVDLTNVQTIGGLKTFTAIPLFSGGTSGATAPLRVDSTFLVTNLNADLLDGVSSSAFASDAHVHSAADITSGMLAITRGGTGSSTQNFVDLTSGQTIAGVKTFNAIPAFSGGTSGATAPFTVDSSFVVASLNADSVDGLSASAFATAAHVHSATDITSGTLASARLSGSYTGITNVGILTDLDVNSTFGVNFTTAGATPVLVHRDTNDGNLITFIRDGASQAAISISGGTVSYGAFTGSHYAWTDEKIEPGMLVSMTGLNRHRHDNRNSEIVYGIMPSSVPNDPKCLGAYLSLQEPAKPFDLDNPHLIAAAGNGDMWVVDTGIDIAPGDWLIASHVRGCAMRDDPVKFPLGHVIARAAEPVDWSRVTPRDGIKRAKISVLFDSFARNSESTALASVIETQKRELAELEKRLTAQEKMNAALAARFAVWENATAQTEKNTQTGELSDNRGNTGNK